MSLDRYDMNSPDGATHLLERAQIKLTFGRRYGLVGKNGSGMLYQSLSQVLFYGDLNIQGCEFTR